MKLLHGVVLLCGALMLGGCGALESSANTLGPTGPTSGPSTTQTQFALFQQAYKKAYTAQESTYEGRPELDSQTTYKRMAEAGFGIVKANCSEFFRKRGESQKWLQFGADAAAVGGALATGILAVAGTSTLAVSIVALVSATTYSSIDVYAKNFLFGAENIDSVRTLTMNAISADATRSLSLSLIEWDFNYAANSIMANQEVCKPASILALTREAIKGSKLSASESSGAGQVDGMLKELIGLTAGMPSGTTLSDTQISALCWAASYRSPATEADAPSYKSRTLGIPRGPNNPEAWRGASGSVATVCRKLSPSAQAYVDKQIEGMRAAGAQSGTNDPVVVLPPAVGGASQRVNTITANPSQ